LRKCVLYASLLGDLIVAFAFVHVVAGCNLTEGNVEGFGGREEWPGAVKEFGSVDVVTDKDKGDFGA